MTERTPLHEWEQDDDGSWRPSVTGGGGVPFWTRGAGEGGVTDHGDLTGLEDDDHPQYLEPNEVLGSETIIVDDNQDGTITLHAAETGASVVGRPYLWSSSTTGDPGTGHIGTDLTLAEPSGILRVSKTDANGNVLPANVVDLIAVGDSLIITDDPPAARYSRLDVTGAAIESAGFISIPVERVATSETTPVPAETPVRLRFDLGTPVITDHGQLSGLGDDDHPQYVTHDEGDVAYDAAGTAAAGDAAHVAASDPHGQYLTAAEGNAAYDAKGAAASGDAAHAGAADPHAQYLTETEANLLYDALGAASSGDAAHVAAPDPHAQYLTETEANLLYDALGAASSGDAAHVGAADPHGQYLTEAEGDAAYDPLGAASSGDAAHVGAADPHPDYLQPEEVLGSESVIVDQNGDGTITLSTAESGSSTVGRSFLWDTATSGDPGSGYVGTDLTLSDPDGLLRISYWDADGNAIPDLSVAVSVGDSIILTDDPASVRYSRLDVTGAVTDLGTFYAIPVERIATSETTPVPQDTPILVRIDLGTPVITDHGQLSGLSDDDHPQYVTHTEGDAAYEPKGAAAAGDAAHVAASDPHTAYLKPAEVVAGTNVTVSQPGDGTVVINSTASGGGGVTDHGALTGLADDDHPQYVTHTEGDAAYEPKGAAAAGDSAHVSASDPHAQYLRQSEVQAGTGIGVTANGDGSVTVANTSPGVTDHGALGGLADDDHPQYSKTDHTHPVQVATWKFGGNNVSVDPGNGYVTIAGTGSNPRTIALSKVDADGFTRNLDTVLPGDVLVVTDDPETPPVTGFARYLITGNFSDFGTYVVFEALRTDTTGSTQPPAIETRLRLISYPQAPQTEPEEPSPVGGRYSWNDSTVIADPGSGQMRANQPNLADVTAMALSVITQDQWVVPGYGMWPGDIIFVAAEDQSYGSLYEISSIIVHPTWIELGVRFDRGQSADPVAGTTVLIKWTPQVEDAHDHPEYLEPAEVLAGTGITVDNPGDGTVVISTAAAGSVGATYRWRTPAPGTTDPGEGNIRVDSADPLLVTHLYISETDANALDVTTYLNALVPGDEIMITEPVEGAFVRGYVTGPLIDFGTYRGVPFDEVAYQAPISPLADLTPVSVRVFLGSAVSLDHGELGGLGDNDHPQYALATDPGLDEVYVQDLEPPDPGKGAVWIDNDGVTGVAPIVSAIPVGGVIFHGGSQVPPEWLLCDGRAVNRTTYAVLFSIIGTTFGPGNGSSTFNVPNLVSTFPRGSGTPGGTGGAVNHSHDGTGVRTSENGGHDHGGNTGDRSIGHDHVINDHSHNHGGTNGAGSHSHGIPDSSHTHGGTGTSNGFQGAASGSSTTPASRNHAHSIPSSSHNHGGTNSQSNHSHGIDSATHSHGGSTANAGGAHNHGVPNQAAHDHSVPTSATTNHNPPYLNLLPLIYAGV